MKKKGSYLKRRSGSSRRRFRLRYLLPLLFLFYLSKVGERPLALVEGGVLTSRGRIIPAVVDEKLPIVEGEIKDLELLITFLLEVRDVERIWVRKDGIVTQYKNKKFIWGKNIRDRKRIYEKIKDKEIEGIIDMRYPNYIILRKGGDRIGKR